MASAAAPDKKLVDLAFRIKPVMAGAGDELHFVKSPDLYRDMLLDDEVTLSVSAKNLKRITEIKMQLPLGMRDMHFPTAAQVLSQLPKRYHKLATAYSIKVTDGYLSGEEGSVNATATLYKGLLPKSVSGETVVAMGKKFRTPKAAAPAFNPVAAVTTEKTISVMRPLTFRKPEGPQP